MKEFIVEVRVEKIARNGFGETEKMVFIEREEVLAKSEKQAKEVANELHKNEKILRTTVY